MISHQVTQIRIALYVINKQTKLESNFLVCYRVFTADTTPELVLPEDS